MDIYNPQCTKVIAIDHFYSIQKYYYGWESWYDFSENVLRLARTLSEQSYWLYHQTHFIKSYKKMRERVIFEPYDKIIVLRDGFTKNWNSFLPFSRNTSIWAYDVGQYAKRKFAWNIIFVVKGYDEWKMGQEKCKKVYGKTFCPSSLT